MMKNTLGLAAALALGVANSVLAQTGLQRPSRICCRFSARR